MFSSAKIQDSPRALPPGPIAEVALDLESGAAGSTGAAAAGNSSAADSDKVIDVERALSLTLTVRERALARQNAKRWQTDTIWAFVFACVALAGEAVVLGLESQKYASRFTETTPIYLTEDSSSASTSDPPFALAPSAQHGTEFFYWSMFSLILVGAAAQLGSLISMGFFSSIFSDAMRRNGSFSYSEVITPVEFIVHGLTSLLGASSILLYTLISDTSTVNLWTGGFAFAIAAASGYASTIVRRRFYKRNRELLDGSSAWKVPQVLESVGSMEIATSVYLVSAAWIVFVQLLLPALNIENNAPAQNIYLGVFYFVLNGLVIADQWLHITAAGAGSAIVFTFFNFALYLSGEGDMVYANLALALAHAGFLLTSIVRAAVLTLRSTMRRVRADSSNRVAGEVETAAANGEENDEVGENEGEAVEVQEEGSDQAADKEEKATGVKSGNGTGKAKAVAKQLFGGPIVSS